MHEYTTDMYEGMIAETVTIAGDNGDPLHTYLARPLGPGLQQGDGLQNHEGGGHEPCAFAAQ